MSGRSILGQALVLEKGQYTLGASYQHTFVRYHVGFDGTKADLGHIMGYVISAQGSYGVTDRVTIDGDIPLTAAKYIGTQPHGPSDDGSFHSTLQDFHVAARMNVLMRPLFVTPFVRVTVPSHSYQLEGHTAVGKGRMELTPGVYVGREIGSYGYFEAMASHSWVGRTVIESASQRLNRTNGSLEIGYYLTPTFTVSAYGTGVRTHGGWDLPRAFENTEQIVEHDRFDKTKNIQVGGTLSYAASHGVSAYVGYFTTVWARTAHTNAGPTLGLIWSPRPVQQWLARARRQAAVQLAQR